MKGTLEGLESSWHSPGLGVNRIEWREEPEVGARFEGIDERGFPFSTTRVQRVRAFEEGEVRFQTRNTTYVLRREGER